MILSSLLPSIHFFIFGESLVAGQIVCDFSLYWTQIHQLRFIHVLLYLSRKKGIRAIHLTWRKRYSILQLKLQFSLKQMWSHVISHLQSINNDQTFRTEKVSSVKEFSFYFKFVYLYHRLACFTRSCHFVSFNPA